MHDILPADMPAWYRLEDEYRALVEAYGYRQIRTPIVEKTALFARSIGAVTDIVEKEMYSFEDRNGESLSLRPENTASVVRACLQAGLINDQQQRLWYNGPVPEVPCAACRNAQCLRPRSIQTPRNPDAF